ncbi:MAG: L7Ae/L30e/S12e/Gadd45 family ribosomal protein [Gemmatimonadales bacterium]
MSSESGAAVSRVTGLLGLARRAGGVAVGTEAAREAIRAGHARLVLVAQDAAPAQSAKMRRTLAGHAVPHAAWGSRGELGAAVGVAPLSAVAVTHAELAAQMLSVLEPRAQSPVVTGVEA